MNFEFFKNSKGPDSLESVQRGGGDTCSGERLYAGLSRTPVSTEDTLIQERVFVMHIARPAPLPAQHGRPLSK